MPKLMSVKDVEKEYGFNIRTIYFWIKQRTLPHVKIGSRVYIKPQDVDKLIEKNYQRFEGYEIEN